MQRQHRLFLLSALLLPGWRPCYGAAFTQGSVVVVRVGPRTGSDDDAAAPVSLVEIDPTSGDVRQAISLPVTHPLNGAEDYSLSLSGDGRALLLGGFIAAAGTADVRCTPGSAVARGVVAVRGDGSFSLVAQSSTDFDGKGGTVAGGCAAGEIRCAVAPAGGGGETWVVGEDSTIQQEGVMYAGPSAGPGFSAKGPWSPVSPDPDQVLQACTLRNGALWFGGGVGNGGLAKYVQVLAPVGLPTSSAPKVTVSRDGEFAEIAGLAFSGAGATLFVADQGAPPSPEAPAGFPCGLASYSLQPSGWESFQGYLADGEDLFITDALTVAQSQAWCDAQAFCIGFTFMSTAAEPAGARHTYFKSGAWFLTPQNATSCALDPNPAACWTSWRKGRPGAPTFVRAAAGLIAGAPCLVSLAATPGTGAGADATLYGAALDGSALLSWSAAAGARTLSTASPGTRYTGVAQAPTAPAAPAAAAAASASAAGAVLGTLAAVAAVTAGIAFFLPNWGFSVAGRHIVPADIIRGAASGVVNGAAWAGRKVGLCASGASYTAPKAYSAVASSTAKSPQTGAYGAM